MSFVEAAFKPIRNTVVNNKSVGKEDISNASLANKELNNTIKATEILMANIISSIIAGIGIIKNRMADNIYKPNPKSVFFNCQHLLLFTLIFLITFLTYCALFFTL